MVARHKPRCPIVGVVQSEFTWRQLNLVWGCVPILREDFIVTAADAVFAFAANDVKKHGGLVEDGDLIVIVAGVPIGKSEYTNCVKVHIVGEKI
jgi:pyruvate kinase